MNEDSAQMQAVLLAGGLGTRLRPVTETIPKVMADVNGKPFLLYLLRSIGDKGFTRILLLTGYLGDRVEEYFGRGEALGLSIDYSREREPLGTAGALRNAALALDDVFLLMNGDTYLECDFGALRAAHRSGGSLGTIAVCPAASGGNARLGKDNRITDYSKGSGRAMTHIDAGVAVYSKELLGYFPGQTPLSLEADVFPLLIERGVLNGFPVPGPFIDIGEFARLELARKTFRE